MNATVADAKAVKLLVQFTQSLAVLGLIALLLRFIVLPSAGALDLQPQLFGGIALAVGLVFLPWSRWLTSIRTWLVVSVGLATFATGVFVWIVWSTGFRAWWSLPLYAGLWAPVVACLAWQFQPPSEARLAKIWMVALPLMAGGIVLVWWATLNGPGQAPRQGLGMSRMTTNGLDFMLVMAWVLYGRLQGWSLRLVQERAVYLVLGLSFLWIALINTIHPWLLANSLVPEDHPVTLWLWTILLGMGLAAWLGRRQRFTAPLIACVATVWLCSTAWTIPYYGPVNLPLIALIWSLMVPARLWPIALAGWGASCLWFAFAWAPQTSATQVTFMALSGTAVGLISGWQLWALDRQARLPTPASPSVSKPLPETSHVLGQGPSRWAFAAALSVVIMTPVLGITAAKAPGIPFQQAISLLGLLLGFFTYTGIRYWLERQALLAQRDEFEQLRTVLERSETAFVIFSETGHYFWRNPASDGMAGLDDEALESVNYRTHPFYERSGLRPAIEAALTTGQTQRLSYVGPGLTGQPVDRQYTVERIRLAGQFYPLVQAQDLTQAHAQQVQLEAALRAAGLSQQEQAAALSALQHKQEELQALQRQQQVVLDTAGVGLGYTRDVQWIWVNKTFASILGTTPETLAGQSNRAVFWDQQAEEDGMRRVQEALAAGLETFTVEFTVRAGAGQKRLLEVRMTMLDAATREAIFAARDITEERAHSQALAQALEEAQAANRAKQQFLGVMSHEIRTPLNGVMGLLQMLQFQQDLPAVSRHYVDLSFESSQLLLAMLNDLLDYSGLSDGRMSLRPKPMYLSNLANYLSWLKSALVNKEDVSFIVRASSAAGIQVLGDEIRLRQILLNLANNAMKFTHQGSVTVTVNAVPVAADMVEVDLSVRDTGIGMSPETQARLFTPFMQADMSDTRAYGGSGLGLAIVKGLVDRMGGSITVTSVLGVGSEFTVHLRLPKSTEAPAAMLELPALPIPPTSLDESARGQALLRTASSENKPTKPDALSGARQQSQSGPAEQTIPAVAAAPDFSEVGSKLAETAPGQEAISDGSHNSLQGVRILLVEDDAFNAYVEKKRLNWCGAIVTHVPNGQEAVELAQRQPDDFDVVVMDLQMPMLGGLAAARTLRQSAHQALRTIPIVGLSGNILNNESSRSLDVGMNEFIAKPASLETLVAAIRRLVPRHS